MKKIIIILSIITLLVLSGCAVKETAEKKKVEFNAEDFCDDEDVGAVRKCGNYIKVVSLLPGAGATYYKGDGTEIQCPVVAPESMSPECRQLLYEARCVEICSKKPEFVEVPPSEDFDPEERAREIAVEHVKTLPAYTDFNGRMAMSNNVQFKDCEGCFDVEVQFDRDSVTDDSKITRAYMHVELKNWEVKDITSRFEDI